MQPDEAVRRTAVNKSGEVSRFVYLAVSEPGKIRTVNLTCVTHKTSGKLVIKLPHTMNPRSVFFFSKHNKDDAMFVFRDDTVYLYVHLVRKLAKNNFLPPPS